MNTSNLYSNQQIIIPPLRLNSTPTETPRETIKIPPFPTTSVPQLTGYKRPSSHLYEQNIMREPITSKKIKMGPYNMLSRVSFSERDPFWPEGYHAEKANTQKVKVPSLNYHQCLDPKRNEGKGMIINISSRKKENSRMLERPCSRQVQTKMAPSTNNLNDLREPIYSIICQKLEENCLTLFQSMKDLLVLRQQFSPRNVRVPSFDCGYEETMPGTPCTMSEGRSEEGLNSESKVKMERSESVEIQVKQENEDIPVGARISRERTLSAPCLERGNSEDKSALNARKANVIVLNSGNKGVDSKVPVRK